MKNAAQKKEMLFRCAPFDEIFVLFLFLESVKNKKNLVK